MKKKPFFKKGVGVRNVIFFIDLFERFQEIFKDFRQWNFKL